MEITLIALANYDHEGEPKLAIFLALGFAVLIPLLLLAF
jgi:hypothetical protein